MIGLRVQARFVFSVFCHSFSLLAIDLFIFTHLTRLNWGLLLSQQIIAFELIRWFLLFYYCALAAGKSMFLGVTLTNIIPWRWSSPSRGFLVIFIRATFSLIVDFNDIFEFILVQVSLGCFPSSLILFT